MVTYLLIDCPYLCYRAFHSTGNLCHGDIKTGIVYGVLSELINLKEKYRTNRFLLCFDYGKLLRGNIYEPYKSNRTQNKTEEELQERKEIKHQIQLLREVYLPQIGFKNIFFQRGFEADDIIAQICEQANQSKELIIVSADQDLYQLIKQNVTFYNPQQRKTVTIQHMAQQLHIPPNKWHMVKAIAGCTSDNIEGVQGVGEKTAIKYLNDELGEHTKAFQAIESPKGEKLYRRNVKLTKLPFPGVKPIKIKINDFSQEEWKRLINKLGIQSLSKTNPFRIRKTNG